MVEMTTQTMPTPSMTGETTMTTYHCWDSDLDSSCSEAIEADSAKGAAREFAEDYDPENKSYRVNVYVMEDGEDFEDAQDIFITIDPREPSCTIYGETYDEHAWCDAYELVGGIRSNPGVWGEGGGVRTLTICKRCGCARKVNTWDTDPSNGEHFESLEYDSDDSILDEYHDNLDMDTLCEEIIAELEDGRILLVHDHNLDCWAAVDERDDDVAWFVTEDEARKVAESWV
jgi:hypothetical protein